MVDQQHRAWSFALYTPWCVCPLPEMLAEVPGLETLWKAERHPAGVLLYFYLIIMRLYKMI
jgi:hypothetical protein